MKNTPLFLGIDIGTQGSKTVLYDLNKNIIAEDFAHSNVIYSSDNSISENPNYIFDGIINSIKKITSTPCVNGKNIVALGIDCQMAGIMAIDKDFNAIGNLDSWLDTRCKKYTELIHKQVGNEAIKSSGGQIIHSHASKILFCKNQHPERYEIISKFIQPNAYVAGKLCEMRAEDAFMDYTFLHFNCFSDNLNKCFNKSLLNEFKICQDKLPKIVNPISIIGRISKKYADLLGLSDDVKVIAGCGDTAASSLGAGITEKGLAYDVAGSASVFACCTDKFTPDVKEKTLLYSRSVIEGLYLPLSYVSGGGLCLKWYSNHTNTPLPELDNLSKNSTNNNNLYFIPHFNGRTFPLDDNLTGAFLGISQTTKKGDMFKAIMESIAFEYKNYFNILRNSDAIENLTAIHGVGGGSKSNIFAQVKANVLQAKYIPIKNADTAPLAVAMLSAKATGYTSKDFSKLFDKQEVSNQTAITPELNNALYYETKQKNYTTLINNFSKYYTKGEL